MRVEQSANAVFLQVASPRTADAVRQSLANAFVILADGTGTASDPNAFWFEVTGRTPETPLPDVRDVRRLLLPAEDLRRFQRVAKGAGKDLARQFDMFGGAV